MVSDGAFYGVLIALIVVSVMFISLIVMLKMKMPSSLFNSVLTTLHACLFGYEEALIEMIGPRGYRTHVFPKIVANIKDLQARSPEISEFIKSKNIDDAMDSWMKILIDAKIVKGGHVSKNKDDSYSIHVPECIMCHPIHDVMENPKGICPMGLILTAAASIVNPELEPAIEFSHFTPTGTVTKVKFTNEKE